ncbi:protein yellow-like [Trichoplusia ni]|uniref:Protein yellow n=1 Tax=Trichoplusia ni TaxID=7111 RepID=A0A7E5X4J1_TRINI|nr:protein yellow-like [Trichoplusia ni]
MATKLLVLLAVVSTATAAVKLQEMFSWNVVDWNYPDLYSRQQALQSGALIQENALPVGIERWKNKLFVSVPRWEAGIPATLNYIPLDAPYDPSPKLNPYPSFAGNELGNCQSGLNTVYRIKADKCDRLWVLDVGTYGYDPNVTQLCPYTLNVYDLNTDQRIRRYVFRSEDIVASTFIANIALDEGKTCDDTFAYFSDELGYGLIAYSWQENRSWRFNHGFFMPDPLTGDFNIGGLNFQWSAEGIFGITTSPMGPDGYRTLYFSPLASHTQFAVSTRILRDETKVKGSYKDFHVVGTRGANGHTTSKVMDESTGVELYNLIDQNAIGCWRGDLPYKPQNHAVVDKDDAGLIFPSDVKIDADRNVWVISDRMPVFLESTLDYSDINFRIYTAPLDMLVQETVCQPQQYFETVDPVRAPQPKLIAQPPFTFYNTGLGVTANPLSGPVALYSPVTSPRPQLNYSPVGLKNVIPTVHTYFSSPKQTSRPYYASRSKPSNGQPWYYEKRTYDVFEH